MVPRSTARGRQQGRRTPEPAAAFGALFAAALVAETDHRVALAQALAQLRDGRAAVLARLEALGDCGAEIAERMRRQEGVDLDGLAAWGAPTLLV